MKILLVSDMECPALWDHFRPERVEGVDLIISCGDLKRDYLEFLVTMVNRPVFYIPGNHDVRYLTNPPEGCECIDDCVINYRGIRIGGLGGCLKYSDSAYQYTEKEMAHRVRKFRKCIRKAGQKAVGVQQDIVKVHHPLLLAALLVKPVDLAYLRPAGALVRFGQL